MVSNEPSNTHGSHLFSYTIASADMRYIERAERHITLSRNSSNEAFLRGEMPGCGPDCYIDLGQIALEYAMSCEGCREAGELEGYIDYFGDRLGKALVTELERDTTANSEYTLFVKVIECILRSTSVTFEMYQEDKQFTFKLEQCPITEATKRYGVTRGKEMAHRALVALCLAASDAVVPGSKLLEPSEPNLSDPLNRLVIALP